MRVANTRAIWGLLFSLCILAGKTWAEDLEVVMFTSDELRYGTLNPKKDEPFRTLGSAKREIGRQMILLVAREEFGLSTRDEALLEPVDRDSSETFWLSVHTWSPPNVIRIRVERSGNELLSEEVKFHEVASLESDFEWARRAYEMKDRFITMFESAGYNRHPSKQIPPEESGPLSDELQLQLKTMHHLAQFRAVRTLHKLIRERGETYERIAGLAKSYATLCQLTLTTPDHRAHVFAARAMLYGERLRAMRPDSPLTQWDIAYAQAMIGNTSQALARVDEVNKLIVKSPAEPPEWWPLIEDYCHYRFEDLAEKARDEEYPYQELAALLWYRVAQHSMSEVLEVEIGNEVMTIIPHCLWVIDSLTWRSGVGYGHFIVDHAPKAHASQLAAYLPTYEELPEKVLEFADNGTDSLDWNGRATVAKLLVNSADKDQGEPSLAVLGRNIEAFNVLHVLRRGVFLKYSLALDFADEIDALEPVFGMHNDAPLIRSLSIRPGARPDEYAEVLKGYSTKEPNWYSTYRIMQRLPNACQFADMSAEDAKRHSYWVVFPNEQRFLFHVQWGNSAEAVQYAQWMASCSMHSPLRFATMLGKDWESYKDKADEWLAVYGQNPSVVLAVADGRAADEEIEKAIKLYERYLAIAPDSSVFNKLGTLYYEQENDEKWLATMHRVFQNEDYGLTHSSTAARIAATLMRKGDFQKAAPYAKRAAQSGSGRGYVSYLECLTGLGEFEIAERVAERLTTRYGMNSGTDYWYNWCAQTGKGDLDRAWMWKKQRLKRNVALDDRGHEVAESMHLLVAGQEQAAAKMLAERLEKNFSPWDTIMLLTLYDRLGKTGDRDRLLQSLIDHDPDGESRPAYCLAAPFIMNFVKTGEFDEDTLFKKLDESYSANVSRGLIDTISYFIGDMLYHRGDTAGAIMYWSRPARDKSSSSWARILAWCRLRDAGVNPIHVECRHFSGEFYRPQDDYKADGE